jgi:hypothetical protein
MKTSLLNIDKPEVFFVVEQNDLNNNWMVWSEYAELPQCFWFKRKHEATKLAAHLNEKANDEYEKFIETERSRK